MAQRWVIRASRALWLWEVFWNVCAAAASSDMDQDMEKAVVLVVEDEALIRISAVHIVEDAGFMAVDACDAEEAIAILERRNDIWAVFTDIVMGRTKAGLRLAKVVRNRWPPIHLILTSGLTDQSEFPANGRFIGKPYTAEQVAATLHELFASKPAPYRFTRDTGRNLGRLA
ncbi:MAG TPA: response regulator [Rhizomicrobium sp.]|jgi:CheY-like chemotaxis protein|nr:response regulator [Rhizomicrobium sp.]